jgi:hypothetical protein
MKREGTEGPQEAQKHEGIAWEGEMESCRRSGEGGEKEKERERRRRYISLSLSYLPSFHLPFYPFFFRVSFSFLVCICSLFSRQF